MLEKQSLVPCYNIKLQPVHVKWLHKLETGCIDIKLWPAGGFHEEVTAGFQEWTAFCAFNLAVLKWFPCKFAAAGSWW